MSANTSGTPEDARSCALAKHELRQQMIARRECLDGSFCERAAEGFRQSLPALMIQAGLDGRSCHIAAYAAIRKEADILPACCDLARLGHHLYFPAIEGRGESARIRLSQLPTGISPHEFLIAGRFGINEPPRESWLAELPQLDLVLLPGLAFDRAGNRLGWGRAFYDRLIPTLPGQPELAAVCYDFQIIEDGIPCEACDQPVHWLLTPEQAIRIPHH